MKYRDPIVAGSFYPQSPDELKDQLAILLTQQPATDVLPKALIVPHAGYYYSGKIAAGAYSYLKNHRDEIHRVILLGPSHQIPLRDCALPSHDAFDTPLGSVAVDRGNCQHLLDLNLARQSDLAHQWEHSLEVQLPFLQYLLKDFELIPVVVGCENPAEVSEMLAAVYQPQGCLVVISTDLSHYHCYDEARRLDKLTIDKILNFDPDLKPHDACGCSPLNGLLDFSRSQGWRLRLVSQANSGDVASDKTEVVGYASFVLY